LHRYIPVLAHAFGFKITELVVRHHPRRYGRSKYGLARYFRGFLDLLTVLTITRFAHRPSHLFGGIGAILIILGTGFLAYLTALKIFSGAEIGSRPLLTFGVLLDVIGVQLLLFGMLAELVVSRSPKVVQLRELVMKEAGSRAV
jgi:dolichol-phosphate mannosyltransferase